MADDIMPTRQGHIRCPMTRYVMNEHQLLLGLLLHVTSHAESCYYPYHHMMLTIYELAA